MSQLLVFTEFELAHSILRQCSCLRACFKAIVHSNNTYWYKKPVTTGFGAVGTDSGPDRFQDQLGPIFAVFTSFWSGLFNFWECRDRSWSWVHQSLAKKPDWTGPSITSYSRVISEKMKQIKEELIEQSQFQSYCVSKQMSVQTPPKLQFSHFQQSFFHSSLLMSGLTPTLSHGYP